MKHMFAHFCKHVERHEKYVVGPDEFGSCQHKPMAAKPLGHKRFALEKNLMLVLMSFGVQETWRFLHRAKKDWKEKT